MKVTNPILNPDGTYTIRRVEKTDESTVTNNPHRYRIVIRPEDVVKNSEPRVFSSLGELLSAPDPEYIVPKKVSQWAWLTGDNPHLLVSSFNIPFAQQRKKAPRPYGEHYPLYATAKGQATTNNGIAKAIQTDNQALSGFVTVILGVVCLVAIIGVGFLVLPNILSRGG